MFPYFSPKFAALFYLLSLLLQGNLMSLIQSNITIMTHNQRRNKDTSYVMCRLRLFDRSSSWRGGNTNPDIRAHGHRGT